MSEDLAAKLLLVSAFTVPSYGIVEKLMGMDILAYGAIMVAYLGALKYKTSAADKAAAKEARELEERAEDRRRQATIDNWARACGNEAAHDVVQVEDEEKRSDAEELDEDKAYELAYAESKVVMRRVFESKTCVIKNQDEKEVVKNLLGLEVTKWHALDEEHIRTMTHEQIRGMSGQQISGFSVGQTQCFFKHHRERLMLEDERPINLKEKGWKLAGLTDALTTTEALAAGFTQEECAAAFSASQSTRSDLVNPLHTPSASSARPANMRNTQAASATSTGASVAPAAGGSGGAGELAEIRRAYLVEV